MPKFVIDPEFRDYLPPQTPEEAELHEERILADGVDPSALKVAKIGADRILIDGHHTLAVCQKHKIKPPPPKEIPFPDRERAIGWMRVNQLGRRNLTDARRALLIGEELNARKEANPTGTANVNGVADLANVSKRTVIRAGKFAKAVGKAAKESKKHAKALVDDDPDQAAVIAADGQIIKLFCRSCRVGVPRKGCPECKELRAEVKADAKRQKERQPGDEPKPERVKRFGWKEFDAHFTKVVQSVDVAAKAVGRPNGAEAQALHRQLAEFRKGLQALLKLEGGD
jgi:hypothetical protein